MDSLPVILFLALIAAAVAYIAADEAAFVNGTNLVVDGGLTASMNPMIEEFVLE